VSAVIASTCEKRAGLVVKWTAEKYNSGQEGKSLVKQKA
jgi:hypothetical protein